MVGGEDAGEGVGCEYAQATLTFCIEEKRLRMGERTRGQVESPSAWIAGAGLPLLRFSYGSNLRKRQQGCRTPLAYSVRGWRVA
jgi:hypothetical protein